MYNRIKDLRIDNDLTQQQLADILNISQRKYSYIETGFSNIPSDILIDLSKIYSTSVDYLLSLTDVNKPYPRSKQHNL